MYIYIFKRKLPIKRPHNKQAQTSLLDLMYFFAPLLEFLEALIIDHSHSSSLYLQIYLNYCKSYEVFRHII